MRAKRRVLPAWRPPTRRNRTRADSGRAEAGETPRERAARGFWLHALFGRLGYLRAAAALLRVAELTGLSSLAGWLGFRDAVALAPRIAGRFFTPRGQRFDASNPQGLAFLHAGCVMQVAFPQVHEATIRMLLRAGLSVVVPPNRAAAVARSARRRSRVWTHACEAKRRSFRTQRCRRLREQRRRLWIGAQRVRRVFRRRSGVVAASASLLRPRPRRYRGARRGRTRSARRIGRGDGDVPGTVSSRARAAGDRRTAQAPAKNSRLAFGRDARKRVVLRRRRHLQPHAARDVGPSSQAQIEAAEATGASVVATANPGCAIQVAAGLRASGSKARVKHVVELLDEAYRAYGVAVTRA